MRSPGEASSPPPLRQLILDCCLQHEERNIRTEAQRLHASPSVSSPGLNGGFLSPLTFGAWRSIHCPTAPSSHPLQSPGGWPSSVQRNAHHRATGHAVPSSWNTLSPSPQPSNLGPIHISAEELLWKQIPLHRFWEHQGSPPPSICHNAILFVFKFTSLSPLDCHMAGAQNTENESQ